MNAYIYQADLLCDRCAKLVMADEQDHRESEDSDDYPQGPYTNGGGEADCPQHCSSCGLFLENDLTDDGINYVREVIRKANPSSPSPAVLEWSQHYSELCYCSEIADEIESGDADECKVCYFKSKRLA